VATPEDGNGGESIGFQTNCKKGEEVVVKVVVDPVGQTDPANA
jgi:hypothetical protein